MSSVLKATIENKTTSVTTHFKESNNGKQYANLQGKILKILRAYPHCHRAMT